ncbi:hypothetical protein NL676_032030 [Syzygium grande]|nr:hypothetical protein NL676_032030 [Syzygium grande]
MLTENIYRLATPEIEKLTSFHHGHRRSRSSWLAPHLSTSAVSSVRCLTARSGGEGLDLVRREKPWLKISLLPPTQQTIHGLKVRIPDLEPWPRAHCSASLNLPLSSRDGRESRALRSAHERPSMADPLLRISSPPARPWLPATSCSVSISASRVLASPCLPATSCSISIFAADRGGHGGAVEMERSHDLERVGGGGGGAAAAAAENLHPARFQGTSVV